MYIRELRERLMHSKLNLAGIQLLNFCFKYEEQGLVNTTITEETSEYMKQKINEFLNRRFKRENYLEI